MTPRLSIIILTCNQRDFTLRLLHSMEGWLRASGNDVEVILVDNGSTDSTSESIRAWLRESGITNLRLIEAGENIGVARGRNLGLKAARGEVLMLLDNDTVADGRVYDELCRYVEDTPACGIAAPALYSPDGELQASAKPYPSPWLKLRHVLSPGRESAAERAELANPHPYYVIGACQVFRRDVLGKVGLLDEDIFYGPEDCDFCIRVRKAGFTIDYLPQLRLTHDWRRATRRSPLGTLGRRHLKALLRFWMRHPRP
ncbi:MAG: glycosyltransferase family 2 protein [Muribaculaceae bacterium]|nr:glycosyltransferase family 2 protein [Muribaculaceae bacterium]